MHAEDWRHHWYIGSNIATTIPTIEQAEALAYTAEAITGVFDNLIRMEQSLCGTGITAAKVADAWSGVVNQLSGVFQTQIKWQTTSVTGGDRLVTVADVNDFAAKLGLSIAAATLRQQYTNMASQRGVQVDLSNPVIPIPFNH